MSLLTRALAGLPQGLMLCRTPAGRGLQLFIGVIYCGVLRQPHELGKAQFLRNPQPFQLAEVTTATGAEESCNSSKLANREPENNS